jgi:peptidoglycan/LPS O-acetylase OafA/YrhL
VRSTSLSADPSAVTPVTAPRPARLLHVDVMRLFICASVVVMHVVTNANPWEDVAPNAVVNLLHYTRQAFFFISALVLVHASRGGPGQLRRRVSTLGVPYLVWSTIYAVLSLLTAYSWWAVTQWPRIWSVGLIQGTDGYHMYFLLVSVQFAVVFPLFLWLLRVTRGHHGLLLLGSGAVEVATMALFHYVHQPDGWWRPITGESSLAAYQFWMIAGGVAALHLTEFHAWLVRHRALVWGSFVGICAVSTAIFFANVADGEPPEFAGRSLQPVTVPLSLAAIGAFYLLSVSIAEIRTPAVRRLLLSGTYLSFGIYLCHPAILTGLLVLQKHLPAAVARQAVPVTVVMIVIDFTLAVAAAALFSRTPLSKALVGRPRRRRAGTAAGPDAASAGAAPLSPEREPRADGAERPAPAPAAAG